MNAMANAVELNKTTAVTAITQGAAAASSHTKLSRTQAKLPAKVQTAPALAYRQLDSRVR